MSIGADNPNERRPRASHPFRSAVFRGMGVVVPPLFTILIFVWAIGTTRVYLLEPVTAGVRSALVWGLADIQENLQITDPVGQTAAANGRIYCRVGDNTFIPQPVYERVRKNLGTQPPPQDAKAYYEQYVDLTYLRSYYTIPFFLSVFVLVLYSLGKFMAAGLGSVFGNFMDQGIRHLPLVRGVYSGVKQVSDFLFTGHDVHFTRIVAVEIPRKGVWSLGFVTSEGLLDIREAANQPVVTVLVPYSPIPMTGCTLTVLKSDCIDLNMTIDQALQFIVSCGVVVPPQQICHLQTTPDAHPPTQRQTQPADAP
jgi:uncharacterized membrane protein